MRRDRFRIPPALFALALLALSPSAAAQPTIRYQGTCDASAAVAVGGGRFLVVASDEDNRLRVYRTDRGGAPITQVDLTGFLEVDPRKPESDIEAAARLGELVYWIGSHGRSKKGKWRSSRHRLFATRIAVRGDQVSITPVGKPYKRLAEDLRRAGLGHGLAAALGPAGKKVERLAPKVSGLNIEGLAPSVDGRRLLIGLRNPIPGGKALLIPLENPAALIRGGQDRARLGRPILLDLGGLGVRGIGLAPSGKHHLLLAGGAGPGGKFFLYRWPGPGKPAARLSALRMTGNPEAIVAHPAAGKVQILSDCGSVVVGGVACKERARPADRSFLGAWHKP